MEVVKESGETRLVIEQDLMATYAQEIHQKMLAAMDAVEDGVIVMDIAKAKMMDSIGVKLVIGLFKTCTAKGFPFRLEVSSPTILKLLKVCRLTDLIDIHEVVSHG